MDGVSAVVLVAYASLALELCFWSVPSAVSTRQLVKRPEAASLAAKVMLVLPIAVIDALFFLPPLIALAPQLLEHLGAIPALAQPALRLSGVGLVIAGRIVTPWSVVPLRRALAAGGLARSGPFAWSRNPGLLGLFAFYLGSALIYPCAVLLAGFPLYLAHMHRRVRMEEAYLSARFGADYAHYAARVPRYLGLPARGRG